MEKITTIKKVSPNVAFTIGCFTVGVLLFIAMVFGYLLAFKDVIIWS